VIAVEYCPKPVRAALFLLVGVLLAGCQSTPAAPVAGRDNTHYAEAMQAFQRGEGRHGFGILAKLAQEGHRDAQAFLGAAYASGEGVPRDLPRGLALQLDAAKQGHGRAQYNVGVMYFRGLGTAVDMDQAVRWMSAAAEQGLAEAQLHIGLMHEHGWGVVRCPYQASHWYYTAGESFISQGNIRLAQHAADAIQRILPGYYLGTELADEIFLATP
jgi:TPR repeat protein